MDEEIMKATAEEWLNELIEELSPEDLENVRFKYRLCFMR